MQAARHVEVLLEGFGISTGTLAGPADPLSGAMRSMAQLD
jgi:hypothetical protein